MALKGALIWLCSLAVLSFSAPQDESVPQSCDLLTEELSASLKMAEECLDQLPSGLSDGQQAASLLLLMRNLTESLYKRQVTECHCAEPKKCPAAEVPNNGGLVCATVDSKRYCKPLCNWGYDFGFMRRSRIYDECSKQTGYKWNTQYVGGNKLAVCNDASIQVSGAATAYFPKDQDCLTTKSSSQLVASIIQIFTSELESQGIQGEPQNSCIVCGRP